MIVACPNRFSNGVEPLMMVNHLGKTVLFLFDGSGSWGVGASAAGWLREWLAADIHPESEFTPSTITERLTAAILEVPEDLRNDDLLGWTFSLAIVLFSDPQTVVVGATGALAAVCWDSRRLTRLVCPLRVVDQLLERGIISTEEVKTHKLRHVISGPFFGDDDQPALTWADPIHSNGECVIAVGDHNLPQILKDHPELIQLNSAMELRAAVEANGGASSATALVKLPVAFEQ